MKSAKRVDLAVVQEQEGFVDANVRLGGYDMPAASSFETYRVVLDEGDLDRLFLLAQFGQHTKGNTARLQDVLPEMVNNERVAKFASQRVDLRTAQNLVPMAVCAGLDNSFTFIDGNHRCIAQYLVWSTFEDVPVYVAVHPRIHHDWGGWTPSLARR
jgi:hypothetical protein